GVDMAAVPGSKFVNLESGPAARRGKAMPIDYHEGRFQAFDETVLYERRWRPEESAQAAVVIVHGYGHHSGSFNDLGERLAARGIAAFAYDQRGFGKA